MISLLCFSTYVCFAGMHKTHKFYIEISILQCNCSYELRLVKTCFSISENKGTDFSLLGIDHTFRFIF